MANWRCGATSSDTSGALDQAERTIFIQQLQLVKVAKKMKTTPPPHSVHITSSGIFSEIWLVPSAELHSIEPVAESLQPRPQATRKVPPTVPELCQKQGSL